MLLLLLTVPVSSLTQLAREIPIQDLLIPPSTYLTDRRISDDIHVSGASGKRAFGARNPFLPSSNGGTRFPRVLRETSSFLLKEQNITSEGLFRVPPHSRLRDCLKEAYDRGQKYIVWKDNDAVLPVPPYPHAEHQEEILAEVAPTDAYSVFMAAALVKAWYASLRQPIFPTDSYRDLKRLYGDPQEVLELDKMKDLFSLDSEWSVLPAASREIVVRHLLPLLSAVAARQEQNKMTAENLAVCFAPGLLCGPDQLEDAKMSSVIRRIFTQAIDMWTDGLREACGQTSEVFYAELKLPKDVNDWEDPIAGKQSSIDSRDSLEELTRGITLQDNEKPPAYSEPSKVEERELPPPLPPRPQAPSIKSSAHSSITTTKRKPAPPLQVPPRYSTVVSDAPEDVAESPSTYAATTDGFAPPRPDDARPPPLPPRWNTPDDQKSGTSNPVHVSASARYNAQDDSPCPISTFASKLNIPKRKTLTPAQVDSVDKSVVAQDEARKLTIGVPTDPVHVQSGIALPGLTNRPSSNTGVKRTLPSIDTQSETTTSPTSAVSPPAYDAGFRRPSIPASATSSRAPSFTSLARPVYPSTPPIPTLNSPPSKSHSLPNSATGPRLRAPSAALLQRMPSFEKSPQQEAETCPVRRMLDPKKLNTKKQSVEDLRRLYEERAGTANALVEAGRPHRYA